MARVRSYAPARRKPAPPARLPAASKPVPATAQPQPQAAVPQMMLGLQRLAGNRAVSTTVAGASAPGAAASSALRIQRLMTAKEFKTRTDIGLLGTRGKTVKAIDALLNDYHALRAKGLHVSPGATQDRAINILHELVEDIDLWKDTHKDDKSRSARRFTGMRRLGHEAQQELNRLTRIRDAARDFMGEKQAPVERTDNKLKMEMEGPVTSVFAKLGPVFSAAAPTPGDTAELEVSLKLPCEPSGVGYLGFRLKAQVERLKKQATKLRFELTFQGGAKIPNAAEIGGEIGGFMEAQGGTPEKALELLSYGLYRRIRESPIIPNEVANFIWGGSTSGVGWGRAEKWSAKVEEESLKDPTAFAPGDSDEAGAYVETGALVGAKAKGGVGNVAELEGGVQFTTGTKYTHQSVKALKGRYGGKLGKPDRAPTRRGQVKQIGESTHHLEFAFGAKGGPFSGSLKVGVDWATKERNKGAAYLQSVKVGLETAASIPMTQLLADGVGGAIIPIAASVVKGVRSAATGTANDKRSKSQNTGEVIGVMENGAQAVTQLAALPAEAFKLSFDTTQPPPAFSAPVDIKLSLQGMYDFFEKKWVFEFKLEYIKGIEVNLGGVFEGKLKKGQRLLRVVYDGGTWAVD